MNFVDVGEVSQDLPSLLDGQVDNTFDRELDHFVVLFERRDFFGVVKVLFCVVCYRLEFLPLVRAEPLRFIPLRMLFVEPKSSGLWVTHVLPVPQATACRR